ncbi:hypothetical protein GH714_000761 [Hevea brasiliensis]|uniref:DUF4219 domain-containing protein n=1 Tax=Hevea brasiliensis TaxID=3981 RepID=A0A6A6L9D0_HEVBR|nr:hypothetical protein GH714_000761 [Hevea brasiliensis]
MEGESSFSVVAPPVFDGEDYQVWAVRMEAFLDACDLWEAVEEDYEHMKESETVKVYVERLSGIANKVRILGAELTDNRIVQKILVSLLERYEATIASLENTKDLSKISLAELVSALQAQEQRRMMRQEGTSEGALQAKWQQNSGDKNKKWKGKKGAAGSSENAATESNSNTSSKGGKYSPCQYCGRKNHPHYKCWRKPDMRCRKCKKLGHAEIICKEKETQQQGGREATSQQETRG